MSMLARVMSILLRLALLKLRTRCCKVKLITGWRAKRGGEGKRKERVPKD
jgi:hypothetical protein